LSSTNVNVGSGSIYSEMAGGIRNGGGGGGGS